MPKFLEHDIVALDVNYETRVITVDWYDGDKTTLKFTKVSPGGLILLAAKRLIENERNNRNG